MSDEPRRRRLSWRRFAAPRDDTTQHLNRDTQPFRTHPVFNNARVVPEGWYPLGPASQVSVGNVRSYLVAGQRVVVWRGSDGALRCLDAFCPHMGADLGNGRVEQNDVVCYFHGWRFDGEGLLTGVGCGERPDGVRTRAWPVTEGYGFVWAWAGRTAAHPLPRPPGLESGEVVARHLGRVRLFAHHHVMMAGAVDVPHFATVHGLSADLDWQVTTPGPLMADWSVSGPIPASGWRGRVGRRLLGDRFAYVARFAGGGIVTLTYGPGARLGGTGRALPTPHLLWGCTPRLDGVSDVDIFLVAPAGEGVSGRLRAAGRLVLTALLLVGLNDDDVRAFPWMRFQIGRPTRLDESVLRLVRFVNGLPTGPWSGAEERL